MPTRIEWSCPGCQKMYAVPSTDGLTICPKCAAAIASERLTEPKEMEIEFREADHPGEWTCPGCRKKYVVPTTDGLTVCPKCAASIASPRDDNSVSTESEIHEAGVTAGFPEFDSPDSMPAHVSPRRHHGPFGFVFGLASWTLGMYLAWCGYSFLGKPNFVFRQDAVRWTLEIHRDKLPPVILPLWRHR